MLSISKRLLVAFALVALAAPSTVAAQNPGGFVPQLAQPDIGPQERLRLTAGSGVKATWNNVQIGPYEAKLLSYPGQPTVTVYCNDYLNTIRVNHEWTANIATLTPSGMATTRLGLDASTSTSDALARYKKAAWLAAQFAMNRTRTAWSAIHAAIWDTALPGPPAPGDPARPWGTAGADWLAAANAAEAGGYTGFDFTQWRVVTDVLAAEPNADPLYAGTQEYLVQVTPEPGTWVLLGTGLLAILFVGYRRRSLAEAA